MVMIALSDSDNAGIFAPKRVEKEITNAIPTTSPITIGIKSTDESIFTNLMPTET